MPAEARRTSGMQPNSLDVTPLHVGCAWRYNVIAAAGGAREVEPGVLDDEPKGGFRSPIPAKYANPDTTDILVEVKEQGRNDFTIELK
jgi:hypothetical protein